LAAEWRLPGNGSDEGWVPAGAAATCKHSKYASGTDQLSDSPALAAT